MDSSRKTRLVVTVVAALLYCATASAVTIQENFDRGVGAFEDGRFEEAAGIFNDLCERYHVTSPDLLVNAGAAEFEAGRPGNALYRFHEAMATAPGSGAAEMAEVNAQRVRASLNRQQGENPGEDGFIFGKFHDAWTVMVGWIDSTWAVVTFLATWAMLFVAIGLLRVTTSPGWKRRLSAIATAAAVLSLLTGIASYGSVRVSDYRIGIVLAEGTGFYDEVAAIEPSMSLPDGLEVRVLDARGGFTRVCLSSGREGYVPDDSIGIP